MVRAQRQIVLTMAFLQVSQKFNLLHIVSPIVKLKGERFFTDLTDHHPITICIVVAKILLSL